MLALLLALSLVQTPSKGKVPPPPSAAEAARLYFLAGDLAKAQDWARRGIKKEAKVCGPLNTWIAEYAFLANHIDEFEVGQARAFLELDRHISPKARGKLTEKAYARYVTSPLTLARSRASGDVTGARLMVEQVLRVDPANTEAISLQKELLGNPGNRPDAGP